MIDVLFTSSKTQHNPAVAISSLKPLLGKTKVRRNDLIILKVVNGAGSIAEFDFTVKGDSAIANGWNPAVFGAPTATAPISLGVCEVKHAPISAFQLLTRLLSYKSKSTKTSRSNTVSKTKSATNTTTSSRAIKKPTKTAIVRALKNNNGNRTATAYEFNVSPRTLGRWLDSYSI